jgi:hypothetical protein
MTIKDLFGKSKVAVIESSESGSVDLESPTFLDTVIKDNSTFVPFLDFSDPNLFVKFGSAELYYDSAIKRIYQTYPYDGSDNEKLQFQLSSSYLEEWLYYNKYPRSTGYAIFSANGWGSQTSEADGYGYPASQEYIDAAGGLHTASAGMLTGKLYENFDKSIKYDANKNRTQNFRLMPTDGNTIEFWLKKDAFDVASTEKEVILDLWNTEDTSSSDYGRLTIYLSGSGVGDSGANPIRVTLRNGTQGFDDQAIASSNFTTSSLADSSWHHYAISFVSQPTSIKSYFYVDGALENELDIGSAGIDEISGRVNARIGALKTSPDGSSALAGAGKLSGSLDEFRFWKTRRTSKLINQNWFQPIAGGANTEDNNTALGCYYKFNEGITTTNSVDAKVLDYSGRLTNGTWTGYSSASRNTGSCFVSASVISVEEPDPIIYSTHPDVVSLSSEMQTSGSDYDTTNTTYLFQKLPQFLQDEDIDNDDDIKKLFQIISSYFDTIYSQTKVLPELTQKNYFSSSMKPLPFANKLLESRGFMTRELFVDTEVLEFYRGNDLQNLKYAENVNKIKNQIYHNIYNNLDYILKSKGTEKSMRNFLRCFGIDDELVKLNLYTDGGTHYFTDVFKNTSVTKKYLNFNNPDYFSSTVYQTSSANNSNVYISGSGMKGSTEKLERFNAFTFEIDTIIPEKIDITEQGFFDTTFLSSSIGGFHQPATGAIGDQYHWSTEDNIANIQIYTVKDKINSERAKFLITNEDGTLFLTSSFYTEIYSNNRWNLSVRVAPNGYGVYGSVLSSSNPDYTLTFYGVNHQFGEVREEFKLTASLNNTSGSAYVCNPKIVYAGAHYENYTGSLLQESDVQIGGCRYWFDFLEDADLKAHSLDVTSIGVDNATRCGTMFTYEISGTVLPRADMLALNWDFDTVTGSDSSGNFDVFDLTSGSTTARPIYGWLDNIVETDHPAIGANFGASKTSFVENELIYTAKKELPEISVSSENIYIKGDFQKFFVKDDDVSDNFYSLEKSMYQVISDEMLSMFASAVEFNNLMGEAVDRYRHRYKNLDKMRQLFFEKVESDMDFDKFTNYYKWIDSSISEMMTQLFPFSARHSEGIADIVESHILERNKYQNKFPLTTRLASTEGSARGVGELTYNWKFGHAPFPFRAEAENENCLWNKERKERTDISDRQVIQNSILNHNSASAPLLATDDGTMYFGSTYAINRLSKPYKESIAFNDSVHGGTNYSKIKDRDFVYSATRIHGPVSQQYPRGIPQNVMVVGVGEGQGTDAFIDCKDVEDPNEKRKWRFTAVVGRFATGQNPQARQGEDYTHKVKSEAYWPANLISGNVEGGYADLVTTKFKSGSIITNLHSDTFSPTNEIGLQSPFTNAWVGGHQSRHVNLNTYIESREGNHARGGIVIINQPSDGEEVVISDGVISVTFTLKSTATANNHVQIGADAEETLDNFIIKINDFPSFKITASKLNFATIDLVNDEPGVFGNVPMTDTLVFPNRVVVGMSGGTFEESRNGLDDQYTRPEAWRLLLRECADGTQGTSSFQGSNDGAMGFVGPDYGGPYPDKSRKYAFRYREERTKRPVNLKNIKTTTGSAVLGNYTENYEVVHTFGMKGNSPVLKETTGSLLPSHIGNLLPATTNYQTLIAQTTGAYGNVFGDINSSSIEHPDPLSSHTENNRQYKIPATPAVEGQLATVGLAFKIPPHDVVGAGSTLTVPTTGSGITIGIDADGSDLRVNTDGSDTNFRNNLSFALADATLYGSVKTTTEGGDTDTCFQINSPGSAALRMPNLIVNGAYPLIKESNDDDFYWAGWIYYPSGSTGIFRRIFAIYDDGNSLLKCGVMVSSNGHDLYLSLRDESSMRHWLYNNAGANFDDTHANQWTHIAVSFNSSSVLQQDSVTLYINGVSASIDTFPTLGGAQYSASHDSTIAIMQDGDGTNTTFRQQWSGSATNWVFGTGSLLSTDVLKLYNHGYVWDTEYSASEIAAHWKFGGTSSFGTDEIVQPGAKFFNHLSSDYFITASNPVVAAFDTTLSFQTAGTNGGSLYTPRISTFSLTASLQNSNYNGAITSTGDTIYLNGVEYSDPFFSLGTLSGGVTPIAAQPEVSNITEIQRDDLTSSNSIIRTRFSAPGGPEINTRGYLDIGSQEFSVYNAMPFRNLSVLGSGSGEDTTIRVDSPASRREGLRTLYTRHCGRYGIDSQFGAIQEDSYVVVDASYHKINRNTRVVVETGSLIITESVDNFHVSRPIPSQDYGYAWVTASLSEELSPRTTGNQVVFGYWPKDGISKANPDLQWRDNGFDSAVNFPTGSTGAFSSTASGTITISVNPTDGDTITFGTTAANTTTFTFKNTPLVDTHIQIGAGASLTLGNLLNKLISTFGLVGVSQLPVVGSTMNVTNVGSENIEISETFTSPSNTVSGLTGGFKQGLVGVTS